MNNKPIVITIVGPTASGKTNLARRLALVYDGELVSADSRQVYKHLNIGTGKDGELRPNTVPNTSLANRYPELRYINDIPQWLTDFVEPQRFYTVAEYQQAAYEVVDDILRRGKLPIIVGGTGLYISAITQGYDFSPDAQRDPNNPRHSDKQYHQKTPPNWQLVELGIDIPPDTLRKCIDARLRSRVNDGLITEARTLHTSHRLSLERLRAFGLEYKYLADLIDGRYTEDECLQQLAFAIHRYARRQRTWFRHHGNVQWLANPGEAGVIIDTVLKK